MLPYLLFFCSGAAGLVYELVWVRQLVFVFGGTTYAITTVLVAFMAGLGLGSHMVGRLCHRLERPGRVYGLVEVCIGLYALSIPLLLGAVGPVYRAAYSPAIENPWLLTALRFSLSGMILLIPTTLMGATLPLLVRYATLRGRSLGGSVAVLYGINAAGAVSGVLLAGFWMIPVLGLASTTRLAAALNIVIGVLAASILGRRHVGSATRETPVPAGPVQIPATETQYPAARRAIFWGFVVSGFAAMVYQIAWTRALVLSVGSSTYSFTCILAAFILGLSVGSLLVSRWVDRLRNPLLVFGFLELAIGAFAVLIIPIHGRIPLVVQSLISKYANHYPSLITWQFLLIIAVTLIPTALMGAVFPLATRALANARTEAGAATGRAYAINTLGTISGSVLAGFVLIRSSVLGVQGSIAFASILNAFVGWCLVLLSRPASSGRLPRGAAAATFVLVLVPILAIVSGRWDPRITQSAPFFRGGATPKMHEDRIFDFLADGVDMTVSVYHQKEAPELMTLAVNGKPDASTWIEDMTSQLLLGHLPALLAPYGQNACVIGLGSGMTLSAVACQPSYERLDCVEICPEVIRGASFFQAFARNTLTDDPRVQMIPADGRNYLQLSRQTYNVIISEPSNPWISGVANLFTREFFAICRSRLTDDGLLAVWLQGYSTSIGDFRMVVHTLFDVFGDVSLWALSPGDYLLVARSRPQQLDLTRFLARYGNPTVRRDLYTIGLHRPANLLGRYIASGETLRDWARLAPIHTDDRLRLEFSAPRNLYLGRIGLADELCRLQRSPLIDFVRADPANPLPPGLGEEIGAEIASRWAPIHANEAFARGNPQEGLRMLLDAYHDDGTNLNLYKNIMGVREQLSAAEQGQLVPPEMARLLAEAATVRPPTILSRLGEDQDAVAAVLRSWSQQAREQGRWETVVDHLSEAHEIDPADRGTVFDLAYALGRIGRLADAIALLDSTPPVDQDRGRPAHVRGVLAVLKGDTHAALPLLEEAIRQGFPPQEMADDPALEPVRAEARFHALTRQRVIP
jgi:spermidine synthase